jgi:flavin reductase (DIM6/NTAB) family NADH-FMN oxidoreductase RutF
MSSEFSGEVYRELLRRYPTGVTVVSAMKDGKEFGATMNSFTTVSMKPPLIAVFIMEGSKTLNAIESTGKFVVSLLSGDQESAARGFAEDAREAKFQSFPHQVTDEGVPYLPESIGRLECSLYTSSTIADHRMIVGEVKHCYVHNENSSMIYYKRVFGSTR